MYQPQPGDRVILTRRCTNGAIHRRTGTYRPHDTVDAFWIGDHWYAGTDIMHRCHPEAEQTLTPTGTTPCQAHQ